MAENGRYALVVSSSRYADPSLRELTAPIDDTEALALALRDPAVGGFHVREIADQPSWVVAEEVERFFAERRLNDIALFYFTGHGIKDDEGALYFATMNTRPDRLLATAVSSAHMVASMRKCRSHQQVILLDCCYAGAFSKAMLTKGSERAGVQERFASGGAGRVVIAASDAMQVALEGGQFQQEVTLSVFTQVLVEGIRTGAADQDHDGRVSLDELYDYVYQHVLEITPTQTPTTSNLDKRGEIVIALAPGSAPAPETEKEERRRRQEEERRREEEKRARQEEEERRRREEEERARREEEERRRREEEERARQEEEERRRQDANRTARLLLQGLLVAAAAGLVGWWISSIAFDVKDDTPDGTKIAAVIESRIVAWSVLAVALAVWLTVVHGERRLLANRALLGLAVGVFAGGIFGAIVGVPRFVPDPNLSPDTVNRISVGAFAVSGGLIGGLLGGLWLPRSVATGFLAGLAAGALVRVLWLYALDSPGGDAFGFSMQSLLIVGSILLAMRGLNGPAGSGWRPENQATTGQHSR